MYLSVPVRTLYALTVPLPLPACAGVGSFLPRGKRQQVVPVFTVIRSAD